MSFLWLRDHIFARLQSTVLSFSEALRRFVPFLFCIFEATLVIFLLNQWLLVPLPRNAPDFMSGNLKCILDLHSLMFLKFFFFWNTQLPHVFDETQLERILE